MSRTFLTTFTFVFGLCCAPALTQDPTQEIKEIVERIDSQMREIDRWLLESGKKGASGRRGKELLEQGRQTSDKVVEDIDELIVKLEDMRQQSRSQSQDQQQQDQQQQQQQQQQQGGQQNRRENQTPDFIDQERQGQQQQGEQQQGQPQPQGQPDGPEASQQPGENRPGTTPPDQGTERVPPGTGEAGWGDLQTYVNFLKSRGSPPKVPEKFRKYWEAYLKGRDKKK